MPTSSTITRATPPDLGDLVAMIDRLCAYHGDTSTLTLARAHTEFFRQSRLVAFVARLESKAIGYAVIEARWRPMSAADALDIAHLYVADGHRRQGVGRALIATARLFARAQGCPRLTIGTHPDNVSAMLTYRAMGLTERPLNRAAQFIVPLDTERAS